MDELDDSVPYAIDFINSRISFDEARTTLVDYVRQAHEFATWNVDHFATQLFGSISEIVDHVGPSNEEEAYHRIAELCRRHGKQVMNAIAKIREKHDRLEEKITKGSLLSDCRAGVLEDSGVAAGRRCVRTPEHCYTDGLSE
jgi:hypothetical protein